MAVMLSSISFFSRSSMGVEVSATSLIISSILCCVFLHLVTWTAMPTTKPDERMDIVSINANNCSSVKYEEEPSRRSPEERKRSSAAKERRGGDKTSFYERRV